MSTGSNLPNRPVTQIAVDRSNWRIAYLAYAGFNAATPTDSGHVFKTTDGGSTWTDISGDLPDVPGQLDRPRPVVPEHAVRRHRRRRLSSPPTAAARWSRARHGDAEGRRLAARLRLDPPVAASTAPTVAAPTRSPTRSTAPALVVSKVDSGRPVGPGSDLDYTITVQQHRQRRRDRCHGHRPGARSHLLRVGRQRRDGRRAARSRGSACRFRRAAASSCTLTVHDRRPRWTRPSPRSSTTAWRSASARWLRHHQQPARHARSRRPTPWTPLRPTRPTAPRSRPASTTPCTSRNHGLHRPTATRCRVAGDVPLGDPRRDVHDARSTTTPTSPPVTRPTCACRWTCPPTRPTTRSATTP